jgi:hypothetical protein
MMQAGGGQGDQLKGLVMDKEKAEARAKKLGEGVTREVSRRGQNARWQELA